MKQWVFFLAALVLGFLLLPSASAAANQILTPEETWETERDIMPGEWLLCRSSISMPAGQGRVVKARASDGISLGSFRTLRLEGEEVNAALYTVVTARQERGCLFSVHISDRMQGGQLEIWYVVSVGGDTRGSESLFLELSTGDGDSLSAIPAVLHSRELTVFRGEAVSGPGDMGHPVSGACLSLYLDRELTHRVLFRETGENEYMACRGESCAHARHVPVFKTPSSGRIRLQGLPAGTYYLSETRPAEGQREKLPPLEIVIDGEGIIFAGGVECPDSTAALLHESAEEHRQEKGWTLLRLYKLGSRALAVLLTAAVALRRYYL